MIFGKKEALAAYQQIREQNAFVAYAELLFRNSSTEARNAAWVLTQATDNEIAWLMPLRDRLIDLVLDTPNISLKRLTLNLLERMPFETIDLRTDFLDYCLEHMASLDEPPGVQALCMKLAYKQCQCYPELHDELIRTLQSMQISYYQPALKCVHKHILKGDLY